MIKRPQNRVPLEKSFPTSPKLSRLDAVEAPIEILSNPKPRGFFKEKRPKIFRFICLGQNVLLGQLNHVEL
jgi:hypothetical protein